MRTSCIFLPDRSPEHVPRNWSKPCRTYGRIFGKRHVVRETTKSLAELMDAYSGRGTQFERRTSRLGADFGHQECWTSSVHIGALKDDHNYLKSG
ncbi:hypothetical protein CDL15_Pgr004908 [Punica granatum]|uniref:Uncharacterized protein n=1 Tax=Punica granatum TaxID=22663 RepID=A0A218Y2P9_PUNGR|nr:hypothetical protein CDL15_Pgr004908 [Punica granatum]